MKMMQLNSGTTKTFNHNVVKRIEYLKEQKQIIKIQKYEEIRIDLIFIIKNKYDF